MEINKLLIKNKIKEYIYLLKKYNYIEDDKKLAILYDRLNSLKIEFSDNLKGDALINDKTIKINTSRIFHYVDLFGECFLDETLFHEFSHIANSLHTRLYPNKEAKILDLFVDNTNQPLKKCISKEHKRMLYSLYITFIHEKKEPLLYNQIPNFGVVLLDEVIAQYLAQDLVMKVSLDKANDYSKKNYFETYKEREFTIDENFCYPPIDTKTAFACYEEFYEVAKMFLKKYGLTIEQLAIKSINEDILPSLMKDLNNKQLVELYKDLSILGITFTRYYLLCDRIIISDQDDPAHSKKRVNEAMNYILKK